VTEEDPGQVTRRQALRRLAGAGALLWATPAIQTLDMPQALASHTTSPPPTSPATVCFQFRIRKDYSTLEEGEVLCDDGTDLDVDGTRHGDSCTPGGGYDDGCSLVGSPSTPRDGEWVACVQSLCEVMVVSVAAGGDCWSSGQSPNDPRKGVPGPFNVTGSWEGWWVDEKNNCLHVPQPIDAYGAPIGIEKVGVLVCCKIS
jgi:hypothetical protein